MPNTTEVESSVAQTVTTVPVVVTTCAGTFTVTTSSTANLLNVTRDVIPPATLGAIPGTNPTILGEGLRSPFDDPRVGWIHELRKEDLTREMERFGLDTRGKVEDLRRRFCQFWKDPKSQWPFLSRAGVINQAQQPTWVTATGHEPGYMPESASGGDQHPHPFPGENVGLYAKHVVADSVCEMLGLPPDTDVDTVRQTLAVVLRTASEPKTSSIDGLRKETGPFNLTGSLVTFSDGFQRPITTEIQPEPVSSATGVSSARVGLQPCLGGVAQPSWGDSILRTRSDARPYLQPGNYTPYSDGLPRLVGENNFRDRPSAAPWFSGQPSDDTVRRNRELTLPTTSAYYQPMLDKRSREFTSICDSVRKWNLRFDGRRDPVSFVERLGELIETYSLSDEEVLRAMPELLQGEALLWYRNQRSFWVGFADFLADFETQFYPPGYRRYLDEEIRKRTQGDNESFRCYLTAIATLIRRSGEFSAQQKLNLVYTNMKPDYKLMVRRSDFATIPELTRRAEEYEAYLRDRSTFRPPPPPSLALVPETAYVSKRRMERAFDHAAVKPMLTEGVDACAKGETIATSGLAVNNVDCASLETRRGVQPRTMPELNRCAPSGENLRPMLNPERSGLVCWNCDQRGHRFRHCPKPKRVRCYFCKTEGITTYRCGCRAGNGGRTQSPRGQPSPGQQHDARPPTNGIGGSNM